MTTQNPLSRLNGVKRNGKSWLALCPAHDDHNPSLSISLGDDGRILLNCFAGCSHEQVCTSLGIKPHETLAFFRELSKDPDAWRTFESQMEAQAAILESENGLSQDEALAQAEVMTADRWAKRQVKPDERKYGNDRSGFTAEA